MSPLLRRLPKSVLRRLPRRLAVPVLSARSWPRRHTEDGAELEVPAPFRLEAYWLHAADGDEGPAFSLFHGADEVLRVDGLVRSPHVHYAPAEAGHREATERRVYIPCGSREDLIDRATFELAHNVAYCTGLHRLRSVRTAPVDAAAFRRAAEQLGVYLRELSRRHEAPDAEADGPRADRARPRVSGGTDG